MPRQARRGRPSTAGVTASLRGLIEHIAEQVVARVERRLPGRDELRSVERQMRELSRRVEARGAGQRRGPGRPRSNRTCEARGCDLPHVAHGFCSKHYQAWRRKSLQQQAGAGTAKRARRRGRKAGRRPGRPRKAA